MTWPVREIALVVEAMYCRVSAGRGDQFSELVLVGLEEEGCVVVVVVFMLWFCIAVLDFNYGFEFSILLKRCWWPHGRACAGSL